MKSPGEHGESERRGEEIVGQSERNKGERGKSWNGKREEGGGGGRKIGKLYASHALTLMQGIRSTRHSPREHSPMNCVDCRYKFEVESP